MKDCETNSECGGRREFLVKASALAGGLVLSLSGATVIAQTDKPAAQTGGTSDDAVLKLDAKSPLSKIGGFDTIETKAGKIVVVRTGDTDFKAFSAVCPHKGGPIKYDEKTSQLFCPWHNSRFDATGKVVKGPAKTNLQNYQTSQAVVVSVPPKV